MIRKKEGDFNSSKIWKEFQEQIQGSISYEKMLEEKKLLSSDSGYTRIERAKNKLRKFVMCFADVIVGTPWVYKILCKIKIDKIYRKVMGYE